MSTNNSDFENEVQVKHNSDTSLLSESSDNLTDYSSETSSLKRKTFDTKFPKFIKSKSFIVKKSENIVNQINIVNEEQNEDGHFILILEIDCEKIVKSKSPKKKFIIDAKSDNLDLAISKFGKLKIHKSFHEANLMDTLYVYNT